MSDGVVMHAPDGHILYSNAAAERILGLTRDQLHGRTSMDPRWRAIREDGTPFPGEEHPGSVARQTGMSVSNVTMGVWRPDGSRVWVLINADPIPFGAPGSPVGAVVTFSDVTAHVTESHRLRTIASQLTNASAGSNDGYYEADLRSGQVRFNARFAEIFGYEPGEIEPQVDACQRLIHPADRAAFEPILERALRGETDRFEGVKRGLHKDGHWISILVRGSVVERDTSGTALRVAGAYTDVTERQRALDESRNTQQRFAHVLAGSNDGYWDWDIPGGQVQYSDRWAAMTGRTLAELSGTFADWKAMVHPGDIVRVLASLAGSLRGAPDHFENEHRLLHRDGHWIWVQVRGKVVERDATGAAIRAAGITTDITARRVAEERLHESLAENQRIVEELRDALEHVRRLSSLLPICTQCKQIRREDGTWQRIDVYISERTDTRFSHGMCPDCMREYYGDA